MANTVLFFYEDIFYIFWLIVGSHSWSECHRLGLPSHYRFQNFSPWPATPQSPLMMSLFRSSHLSSKSTSTHMECISKQVKQCQPCSSPRMCSCPSVFRFCHSIRWGAVHDRVADRYNGTSHIVSRVGRQENLHDDHLVELLDRPKMLT